MAKSTGQFQTIRSEGALLPPDVLQGIAAQKVDGTSPACYHLPPGTKLNEAITHSWGVLQKYWKAFKEIRERLPDDETGTEPTNQHWLLPLFEELKYGRLATAKAPEIDGRIYAIERFWADVPIHLIGCNLPLDRRTKGARGAATATPHSMMQEFLNRREESLWGFMSNGLVLRMLRDNVSLSRQAYVEFDLEAMMDGEVYADFALLWMLCHQSRVEADKPQDFWLEKWSQLAREQGTRVLSDLRMGVAKAIEALGRGFIGHPRNDHLREQLQSGALDRQEYYRQLLRIVYRLLFLFVAEDRGLLHGPDADPAACELYDTHYSTRRLRELADQIRGSKHADLWHSLSLVSNALGRPEGCPELGLPALGSFLWRRSSTEALSGPAAKDTESVENPVLIRNDDLLAAVRALAYVEQDKVRRTVDYRNLGSEELGSVYESLLELHPRMSIPSRTFELSIAAGHERKTTGSYYTPDSLVQCLLDSALEPVVDDRLQEAKRLATGKWETDEEKRKALNIVAGKLPLPAGERAGVRGTDQPAEADLALVAEAKAAYETVAKHWDKTPTAVRHSRLAEQALLELKVCDPATGSGHFLIAAAHRLARHLARVRTDESEPSPDDYQHALRDVIGHCIYGVDINPMAVELCKVSLWMEALEPGKPLSFLEHHIQCGNSLLGTTPALLKKGIPDDAFKPIQGDDKTVVQQLKRDNKQERKDYERGYRDFHVPYSLGNLPAEFARLTADGDETVGDIADKERRYVELVNGAGYQNACLLADMWCAAFVWTKEKTDLGRQCPTERFFRRVEASPHSLTPDVRAEIECLRDQYQFFHWHLAFPNIFRLSAESVDAENQHTGWSGGFDVVLGNPPWERVKLQEKEWFAERAPHIANAPNAATRRRLVKELEVENPKLHSEFRDARRIVDGQSLIIRQSNHYPLCGSGEINTYSAFAEAAFNLVCTDGRVGQVLPSGIVIDQASSKFFEVIMESRRLLSVDSFENESLIFRDVHHFTKFCLLTLGGKDVTVEQARFVFFIRRLEELDDDSRYFTLSYEDLRRISPSVAVCPTFRNRRDAKITTDIYSTVPLLRAGAKTGEGEQWKIQYLRMFDMANDSELFYESHAPRSSSDSHLTSLYEGKFIWQYSHRYAGYPCEATDRGHRVLPESSVEQLQDPHFEINPFYLMDRRQVAKRVEPLWNREWLVGWRDVTTAVTQRTVVASILPLTGVGHTCPIMLCHETTAPLISCLLANVNSFVLDYVARQKLGGVHLTFTILDQLPVVSTAMFRGKQFSIERGELEEWISTRVVELCYTAWDLEAFASDCGYDGPPFRWDEERRFLMRAELDAAFFHLYSIPRSDVDYIMDTFPIVRNNETKSFGEYRTKRAILEIYDEMAHAIETSQPYQTRLDPPPGPPTDADGNFIPVAEWDQSAWPPHIHPPKEHLK